jgi:uncharacterized repeat protein (TIGR03806 family)
MNRALASNRVCLRASVRAKLTSVCLGLVSSACGAIALGAEAGEGAATPNAVPYGLLSRPTPAAYLHMPPHRTGTPPPLLSQTGAFKDVRSMTMSDGLIPYDVAVAFWSDGASKARWIAVPKGEIRFTPTGEWRFPAGTVFVKTFELPTDESDPSVRRRLETRLLVRDVDGGVYGVVYKWRPDNSEADLLADSLTENIPIGSKLAQVHDQTWYYPSRKDCLACHNASAGSVLGVTTRQLNRTVTYPSGVVDNQLRAWNHIGLFVPELKEAELAGFPRLAAADDLGRSLEDRARSYLDANCSQCHRPGGTVAYFDARYDTPLDRQQLISGPVLIDEGIDHPHVVAPHDIWRSIAYMRINTVDDIRMPPIARETVDKRGVALMRAWIESLPGRPVLDPPTIMPPGGAFQRPPKVTLHANEVGAEIRYTLDGSEPGTSDALYERPLNLPGSAVLRARTYKSGFTHSITTQDVFIVEK